MKTPHEIAYELMQADPELKLKDAVERGYIKAYDTLTARVVKLEAALRRIEGDYSPRIDYGPRVRELRDIATAALGKEATLQNKAVDAEQAAVRG